jgi:hypothetical protein
VRKADAPQRMDQRFVPELERVWPTNRYSRVDDRPNGSDKAGTGEFSWQEQFVIDLQDFICPCTANIPFLCCYKLLSKEIYCAKSNNNLDI